MFIVGKIIFIFVFSSSLVFGGDDWITGKFDRLDQLTIEIDSGGFVAKVSGPPKVLAEFVETYFDNISDQYRLQPKYRAIVEKEMGRAMEKDRIAIGLYREVSCRAFDETTGYIR
jgi:hypothetical protein